MQLHVKNRMMLRIKYNYYKSLQFLGPVSRSPGNFSSPKSCSMFAVFALYSKSNVQ